MHYRYRDMQEIKCTTENIQEIFQQRKIERNERYRGSEFAWTEKKVISLQDDCVHHILDRIIKKKSTSRYLAVKLQNVQEWNNKKKNLKAIKGKISITIKGIKIIITEDVSVMMRIKSLSELYI